MRNTVRIIDSVSHYLHSIGFSVLTIHQFNLILSS